jgi:hypothetical protein
LTFEKTRSATPEIRAAADLMHDYLVGSEVERELCRGADKLIVHAPKEIEGAWDEFKQSWEPGINLAMCEIDPDWPRDYNEHLKVGTAPSLRREPY